MAVSSGVARHPTSTRTAGTAAAAPDADCDRPCQATANVVLGMLKTIFEERASQSGGRLPIDEVGKIIDQFQQAPGRLAVFYDENRERCFAEAEAAAPDGTVSEFEAKLRALGGGSAGRLSLGRIQLVGLHAVRKRLGQRWQAMAERVQSVADNIIRRHLSPKDSFVRDDKGDTLVCFADLDESEAWLKAKAIEEEIGARLLGSDRAGAIDGLDLDVETLCEVAEIAAEVHQISADLEEEDDDADVRALVARRLDEAKRAVRARIHDEMERLGESWEVEPRTINISTDTPARFVLADADSATRGSLARLGPLIGGNPELLVSVDLLALSAGAVYLAEDRAPENALLAVTVHASSVGDRLAFVRFSSACEELPQAVRDRLILVLTDPPPELSTCALADCTAFLRAYSRLQALRLRVPRLDGLDLHAAGVRLVLVDYGPTAVLLRRDPHSLTYFIRQVHKAGARILVERVPSEEAGNALHDAGLDIWSLRPASRTEGPEVSPAPASRGGS